VVNGAVLPIHEQCQQGARGEVRLHELAALRERTLCDLRQSFQPRRLSHLLLTLKKATGPRTPCSRPAKPDYIAEYVSYKAAGPYKLLAPVILYLLEEGGEYVVAMHFP
jgi:hypothetical protein